MGSLGQFLFAPIGQGFVAAYGWQVALVLLGGFVALVPAFAVALGGAPAEDDGDAGPVMPVSSALRQAFGHGSYLLLAGGFFVCGFHVAFITVHLPPYIGDLGLSAGTAALAIGLVGLFNIVGSYSAGVLGTRHSPRLLLAGIYGTRAAVITVFLLVPPSAASVLVFAAAMGLLWLSTVPLTSALIGMFFGVRHMGTLFGFVFLSHQVGAFTGVWLGGVIESATGSYDAVWWLSVALGVVAATLHIPIAERRAPALAPA
jgi:predicted MFS family arabinose efflux permease